MKPGRKKGTKNAPKIGPDGELQACIATLHAIATGDGLREILEVMGYKNVDSMGAFSAPAYQWASGIARGQLKRLGIEATPGEASKDDGDRPSETSVAATPAPETKSARSRPHE